MSKKNLVTKKSSLFSFFAGIPALVWQVLFFYIPLVAILFLSVSGASVSAYFVPLFSWVHGKILIRSMLFALGNAVCCLMLAYPLTYFLVFRAGKLKHFFLFLVILPFWTNFLLHIYAWFFVLDSNGVLSQLLQMIGVISHPLHLLNSSFAIGLMMVYFYLPFMVLPLYVALENFDRRLLEVSADLGATGWQTITRVLLPLSAQGIKTGFLLVFVPSFGEFVIPEFMGGDKTMFVGSVISNYMLNTHSEGLGAAFTLISAAVLALGVGVIVWCMNKLMGSQQQEMV